MLKSDVMTLVVQVNGKVRGKIQIPVATEQAQIEKEAISEANVQRYIADKQVRKVIVVAGRLVNVVVS